MMWAGEVRRARINFRHGDESTGRLPVSVRAHTYTHTHQGGMTPLSRCHSGVAKVMRIRAHTDGI